MHIAIFKPDLSNLIKYVEDVATHILYKDDAPDMLNIFTQSSYDDFPKNRIHLNPYCKGR
jgi:Holliday junction resolvase RusA-like endonuclease